MNTRSLRFQLISWYAVLLLGTFGIIGVATYLALHDSLTGAVKQSQLRRASEIGHLLLAQLQTDGTTVRDRLRNEIEDSFAPSQNNRFVRVTARDGMVLYESQARPGTTFYAADLAAQSWAEALDRARILKLPNGREVILATHQAITPDGKHYLIETGAPLDVVQSDMRKWLLFLCSLLPVLGGIAVGGGYLLLNRALAPVDKMSVSAERISSHNLSERLPVADTGDELERLSAALNRMIQRLEESFQHSRRFVADASHELRTPLTIMRGELESCVFEPNLPLEVRERLGSVLDEVVRLSNIVDGLFAISRLDAGEAAADWAVFDLGQLAASTAEQMELLAEDKKLEIECHAAPGVKVEGDRSRMKQVVVNLLDNAIKYTPEKGRVVLTVQAQQGKAVLEVADNGIGIPAEALPRVFERFFRVDKARSREEGGAGLGLSIVRSICIAHEGTVQVRSTPGQGSCFRVELPLAAPTPTSSEQRNQTQYEHYKPQPA